MELLTGFHVRPSFSELMFSGLCENITQLQGFGAGFMETLILLRDVIVAVLLSWVGIDAPADEDKKEQPKEAAHILLSSDTVVCEDKVFETDV